MSCHITSKGIDLGLTFSTGFGGRVGRWEPGGQEIGERPGIELKRCFSAQNPRSQ